MIKIERYLSLNRYFKDKYGEKIGKLSLDAHFSCPNRDGTLSHKGCIFCSEKGAGDFTDGDKNLKEQIKTQKEIAKRKWDVNKFMGYFQNFTNTYGDINYLKRIYELVLDDPDIIGISIATRADCLDDEILDYLEDLSKTKEVWLEIGMQSINENTIDYINRGYSHKFLDNILDDLNKRGIKYILHVIFGLPGESHKDMLDSIKYVREKDAFGIKIHNLYIQNDSPIYNEYLKGNIDLLSKDEYTDLVVEAIKILDGKVVIHRITGDGEKSKLVAPLWAADKLSVIGEINHKLKLENIKI